MRRTILPLAAIAALALTGCGTAAEAEPAPVETVYIEAEPEPEPDEFDTEGPEFQRTVLDLVWADTDADEKDSICWAVDTLGRSWTEDTWDAETSGVPTDVAADFFEEVC